MPIPTLKEPLESVTGIEKPRGKVPSPGRAVPVRRALLPPAACRRPWRGCRAGLVARGLPPVGHQVRSINILWASEMFSSLRAWVKPKGKRVKSDDSGPPRFLALKPTNQALSHTPRGQVCPAAPEWVPWAARPQWKARIPSVCSSGK